ncbi:hypothetical protein AB6819_06020 [Carnobacterium maltaromaticum]|uniref:hypothetical protein n=1 Tax=Carnobacterium maltaromaticum TaxID=2751 RepID=UPI0039BE7E11
MNPAWISSIITACGLFFSIYQLYVLRKKENEEKKIEQAKKIAVWSDGTSKPGEIKGTLEESVTVNNNSELPIFEVLIFIISSKSLEEIETTNFYFGMGTIGANPGYYKYFRVIPPGLKEIKVNSGGSAMGGDRPVPVIFFKDTSGNGWYRNHNGKLISKDNYLEYLRTIGLPNPIY